MAAAVLTEDGHDERTYGLTGPAAVTYADIAEAFSEATGSAVAFVDVPDDAARAALVEAEMPDWLVTHLGALFPLIRKDALSPTTTTVRDLIGREPRSIADFARDHADLSTPILVAGNS